jgi:hypothetical protein
MLHSVVPILELHMRYRAYGTAVARFAATMLENNR